MFGIVLSTIRYGDKSVIANILTPDHGRCGFIVASGSRRSATAAMLMPLSLIEFEPVGKGKQRLQRLTALRLSHPFRTLPFDPTLRSEAFFIAELLLKSVPENIPDPELFDFVSSELIVLDEGIGGCCNFHLAFMMRLAAYMGFAPNVEREQSPYFDLQEGRWRQNIPLHRHYIDGHEADIWHSLQKADINSLSNLSLSRNERQRLIELMNDFYRLHLPNFNNLRSQEVLSQLAY